MEVQKDFRDLLELFNKHGVDYIIVGAYALGFHGAPRYTGDLDILVKPDPFNAKSIMKALDEFGFGSVGLTEADFDKEGMVVQLGFLPVRIDLITSYRCILGTGPVGQGKRSVWRLSGSLHRPG
jgi:hypothetical protein